MDHETFKQHVNRAANLLAQDEITPEEHAEIEQHLDAALTADRFNAGLMFLIGTNYMRARRYAFAEHWLRLMLEAPEEEGKVEAFNNLGFILDSEGRKEHAAECFAEALKRDPNNAAVLNNIATSKVNNGTPSEAIEWCDKALAIQPDHVDAHWNRALALLELGRWAEGFDEYSWGLRLAGHSSTQRKIRHYAKLDSPPWWDGEPGKVVAIYGEQGVGDEIMAASMLEDAARDVRVVFEAHPRLVNIYRHSFGDAFPIYGSRKMKWDELQWVNWERPEARCPIVDLGRFYRRSDDAFPRTPYLKPYPQHVERYGNVLADISPRPKIGISWAGGYINTRSELRTTDLATHWMPLFKRFNGRVDWVSLQYDPADKVGAIAPLAAAFEREYGVPLNHWQDDINDLDWCYGGLIHALDLVISVNTSLVHACGAYGVECWVLTPSRPAWRYGLAGSTMPWYGEHVRVFRQSGDDHGNWNPVFGAVINELERRLSKENAA